MSGQSWQVALLVAMGVLGCASSGCKSKAPFQLDGIDVLPPVEELKEFSLGKYQIPISIVDDRNQSKLSRHNCFQFDFTLYALVSPKEKSQIEDAWEQAPPGEPERVYEQYMAIERELKSQGKVKTINWSVTPPPPGINEPPTM